MSNISIKAKKKKIFFFSVESNAHHFSWVLVQLLIFQPIRVQKLENTNHSLHDVYTKIGQIVGSDPPSVSLTQFSIHIPSSFQRSGRFHKK